MNDDTNTARCLTCTAPVGEDGRWYPGEEMACGYDAGRREAEEAAEVPRHTRMVEVGGLGYIPSTVNGQPFIPMTEDGDHLRYMSAIMQRWRALAGQMTEERDAALIEVERLRGVMAHCPFPFPACITNAECNTEDALEGE